jgi:hypothetical protein
MLQQGQIHPKQLWSGIPFFCYSHHPLNTMNLCPEIFSQILIEIVNDTLSKKIKKPLHIFHANNNFPSNPLAQKFVMCKHDFFSE